MLFYQKVIEIKYIYIYYGEILAESNYKDIEDIYDLFFENTRCNFRELGCEDLFNKYYIKCDNLINKTLYESVDDIIYKIINIIEELISETERRINNV